MDIDKSIMEQAVEAGFPNMQLSEFVEFVKLFALDVLHDTTLQNELMKEVN